jgi:hypothetical protein
MLGIVSLVGGASQQRCQMRQGRTVAILVLLLLVPVTLVLGRSFLESRRFYRLGTASYAKGDMQMAVGYLGRAGKWYFPGNPYVRRALEGLWNIGQKAEETGDKEVALKAYCTLRGALYGTKGLFMPHKAWLGPCNQKIAEVTVSQNPLLDAEQVLSGLQAPVGPSAWWAILVFLGFLGWVGGILGLIIHAFDRSGGMQGKRAALWGGLSLGFFLLWVFSMLKA